jgi:hypothetical protein
MVLLGMSCMAAATKWSAGSLDVSFNGGTAYLVDSTASGKTASQIAEILKTSGIATTLPDTYIVAGDAVVTGVDASLQAYWGSYGAYNAGAGYDYTTKSPTQASFNAFVIVMSADGKSFVMSDVATLTGDRNEFHLGIDDNWVPDASEWTQSGTVGENVPEPTVLALLALGVAGVALRRKKMA